MFRPLDEVGMRTMYVGLFLGMLLYGLGLASRALLPAPLDEVLWTTATLLAMIVLLGWFFAVQRGFRIHRLGRIRSKRRRGRKVREGPKR